MLAEEHGYDQTIPSILIKNNRPSHWSNSKQLWHQGARKNGLLHSFTRRVQDMWNYLPDEVVTAKNHLGVETVVAFEKELDAHWSDQEILYNNYRACIIKKKYGKKL